MKLQFLLIILSLGLTMPTHAQNVELSYGHSLPVKTKTNSAAPFNDVPLRVLLIFAEMSSTVTVGGNWQVDAQGNIPQSKAGEFFDVNQSNTPQKQLSKYFHDASFGNFQIIGDYYERVVPAPTGTTNEVLATIQGWHSSTNPFQTHSGLTIDDFDKWEDSGTILDGREKQPSSNGYM